ncbi:enoyl-ACP reductase [Legionella nautarum]|uniref:Enoyl-[acyl-carrier-protein] reductase [NADH] n=1 Tax=Legionella nautarum TaxID=45070 RepID=A0A0W0WRV9_9GAMM|nr:enoyl-ACP reductase FabI [Legionella nautarum]KTD35059.1 enoyl-ACP reductase [Legionella nautarum]
MIINLKNKQGLVTGIANEHSIAYGCAEQFGLSNAELAITFLNAKAEPYVRPLALQLKSPIILPCDVRKEEEIIALFTAIEKTWGKLDFLLHSMAFAPKTALDDRLVDCTKEGFLEAMDISCHSLIRLTQYAAPLMKNGGSILTMSYYGSQKVVLNYNLMGVVKAALEASVRYLAYDLGPSNIRVNAISPGPIQTRAASGIPNFYEYIKAGVERSPLHRLVDIKNVGNLAAFLVSDAAMDMTGQVFYVDSGYSIMG